MHVCACAVYGCLLFNVSRWLNLPIRKNDYRSLNIFQEFNNRGTSTNLGGALGDSTAISASVREYTGTTVSDTVNFNPTSVMDTGIEFEDAANAHTTGSDGQKHKWYCI